MNLLPIKLFHLYKVVTPGLAYCAYSTSYCVTYWAVMFYRQVSCKFLGQRRIEHKKFGKYKRCNSAYLLIDWCKKIQHQNMSYIYMVLVVDMFF